MGKWIAGILGIIIGLAATTKGLLYWKEKQSGHTLSDPNSELQFEPEADYLA
jgi:hypothetical protein